MTYLNGYVASSQLTSSPPSRSNYSTMGAALSRSQTEWPDSWSSPLLTSFTGSPRLWLPTLSSQAANAISTSLRAPLLPSSALSPSHMARGRAPHFSDNFSSERTGHKHEEKDVHPAQSQTETHPSPDPGEHGLERMEHSLVVGQGSFAVIFNWGRENA